VTGKPEVILRRVIGYGEKALLITGKSTALYRRHMRTIGYLGEIDGFFGAPATTRSWSTMLSVLRILKDSKQANKKE
jgi:hypothetical protein